MSYRLTSTHQMIWLPCLLVGILLMIVGATEGVPYTSIHVRGESVQIAIGVLGLVLADPLGETRHASVPFSS